MSAGGHGERGAVSLLVLALLPVILAIVGLMYDGGQTLNAKIEASNEAAEAARAGANQLAPATRGASASIDPAAAASAVNAYLASSGHQGSVSVNGTEVTVTVTIDQPLVVLGAFGLSSTHVVESATADAQVGISQAGG